MSLFLAQQVRVHVKIVIGNKKISRGKLELKTVERRKINLLCQHYLAFVISVLKIKVIVRNKNRNVNGC